jgi:hypothetical protein
VAKNIGLAYDPPRLRPAAEARRGDLNGRIPTLNGRIHDGELATQTPRTRGLGADARASASRASPLSAVRLDERSVASPAGLLDQPRLDPIDIGVVAGSAVVSHGHHTHGHHDLGR